MIKHCPKCKQEKSISEFHKNKSRGDGLNGWCKNCMSEILRDHYLDHKDHVLEICKTYRENNPEKRKITCDNSRVKHREENNSSERARYHANLKIYRLKRLVRRHKERVNYSESFTIQEWEELCQKYNFRCIACGLEKPLTVDHIIPLSRGGKNIISNIQPLCRSCNSRKHEKVIDFRNVRQASHDSNFSL